MPAGSPTTSRRRCAASTGCRCRSSTSGQRRRGPAATSKESRGLRRDETGVKKIDVFTADGVQAIELNDPPANTYSYEMMRELDEAILAARMDPDVRVIVLRGAGEKFFCAGANIGMLKDADPDFKYYFCLHANETLVRLEQTPKLVVAALNGHAVGGGLEVALAADIRI